MKSVGFMTIKVTGLLVFVGLLSGLFLQAILAQTPLLVKENTAVLPASESIMETTPILWQGRSLLFGSVRRGGAEHTPEQLALCLIDLSTGETLAEFGFGHSLGCAFVENRADGDLLHVFAAEQPQGETWFRNINHFSSRDLKTWKKTGALLSDNEHLLNSSVCRDENGYIMAYESDHPVSFCFKFAKSSDLNGWEKVDGALYAGPDGKSYSACPVIRYFAPYYYVIYLRNNGKGGYESAMIRSKNLRDWTESPKNPIIAPCEGEGINNSDVDLIEIDGKTILYYAVGDQQTWCEVRRAVFDGPMQAFFESCFSDESSSAQVTQSNNAVCEKSDNALDKFGYNAFTGDENNRTNIYVSRQGDNSDGKSWETAFQTIQRGLDAVPDDQGAYRVVVRPDTYMEANLLPPFRGAKGAYNELIGDFDGAFGSGATGYVVIDASDPQRGFKSYDWYSVIRAYQKGWSSEHNAETVSSLAWDRWICRRLYVTGSDAGLFWDCLAETAPFTILVEDCVSIGRAFGIGIAFGAFDPENPNTRPDEPIVFRRTWAASLDRWGDAGAAFLRSCRPTISETPEFYLDDCTLVSPDNAVENNCSEYDGSTHVALRGCRLLVMNFTQPAGTPPNTGIIRTPNDGSRYLIDLEDCQLMGCKVFSDEKPTPPQYTLKGHNRVYIQYTREIPDGMEPMHGWPVELFQQMAPPLK